MAFDRESAHTARVALEPDGATAGVGTAVCVKTTGGGAFAGGMATEACDQAAPTPPPVTTADPAILTGWGAPTWRDEFSGTRIDDTKWNVRSRTDLGLLNDTAIPDASMITVSNGVSHIRAEWLPTPLPRNGGQGILTHRTGYMDQAVRTSGDVGYSQKFGRWETRIKVPTGQNTLGALAAFWLRNNKTGEIDIAESWGFGAAPKTNGQRDGTSTTTIHNLTSGGSGYAKYGWTLEEELKKKGVTVPKVYTNFVTIAFEYTPTYAATYYNGIEAFRATPASHPMLWNPTYFDSPLHVRMNLHVGPSKEWYGIPDPARRYLTTALDYQVDYVRIWAL